MARVNLFRLTVDMGKDQSRNQARFGNHAPALGTLFGRELDREPVGQALVLSGMPLHDLKEDLIQHLGYSRFVLTVFSRGEDWRAVKDSRQDAVLGMLPDRRRHVKCWESGNPGIVVVTAHDEASPFCLLRAFRQTVDVHFQEGKGDYKSGTEGFFEELASFLRKSYADSARILGHAVETVMDGFKALQ